MKELFGYKIVSEKEAKDIWLELCQISAAAQGILEWDALGKTIVNPELKKYHPILTDYDKKSLREIVDISKKLMDQL